MLRKKVFFCLTIIITMLFNMTFVNANYISYSAPLMHVEVNNIEDKIKSIALVIYDENCNVEDAYRGSGLDFSNANFLEASSNNEYEYCATFKDLVDPFKKEDYVFNNNYNKKDYMVSTSFSYTYRTGAGGFGTHEKYKNVDDFIKNSDYFTIYEDWDESLIDFVEEEIKEVRDNPITCERTIFYSANRLVEVKDIEISEIKNNKLILNIDDFSELNKYRQDDYNAGFAIRFENQKGEYTTIPIGSNEMFQDSYSQVNIKTQNLKKNVIVDYKKQTSSNNSYISPEEAVELGKFNFPKVNWNIASSWAENELKKANDNDLIPEIFIDTDLTKNITRREFAHIAVRLYEIISDNTYNAKVKNPFTDTNDEEVIKAYSIGITTGTSDTTFDPDKLVTREEMATMMTRTLEKLNIYTYIKLSNVNAFDDDAKMQSWSKQSIYFMATNEIIKGVGNNNFDPSNNATIEQAIIISERCIENYKELQEKTKIANTPEDVGTINTNYARSYKDVSKDYIENNEYKKIDENNVIEVQVFPYGWSKWNVYYTSSKKDDIEFINNLVKFNSGYGGKGYNYRTVLFVLKDKSFVEQRIYINEEETNKIKSTFSQKSITLSETARLGSDYANYYKGLEYTEEEHKEIINLLRHINPLYEGYFVEHGSVTISDVADDFIWAYQYENGKPVTYTYLVTDSEELVKLLDKINSRKAKKVFSNDSSVRSIIVEKHQNGVEEFIVGVNNYSSKEIQNLNTIFDYLKNHFTEEYTSENYYQVWLLLGYDSFVNIKMPINAENTAFFQSYSN